LTACSSSSICFFSTQIRHPLRSTLFPYTTLFRSNYTGKFEFRKSQCLINGKKIGHNAIAQAQKVYINIKSILDEASIPVNLQGAVIFIGSHNEVVIHDSIEDIDIVRSTQLRNYIWKIAQEERNYHGVPIDFQKIIQALNIFKTENPF